MNKTMWYCVTEGDRKFLLSAKPERGLDTWEFNPNEADLEMNCDFLEIQDDQVASMGLPDMTWNDDPIEVKLVCVNI